MTIFFLTEMLNHWLPSSFGPHGKWQNYFLRYPRPDIFWRHREHKFWWEQVKTLPYGHTRYIVSLTNLAATYDVTESDVLAVLVSERIMLWPTYNWWDKEPIGVEEKNLEEVETAMRMYGHGWSMEEALEVIRRYENGVSQDRVTILELAAVTTWFSIHKGVDCQTPEYHALVADYEREKVL